jgi:hypothetical protein
MPPRGLKTWLRGGQRARLVGSGARKRFEELRNGAPSGRALRGLTKRLEARVWSKGSFPHAATHGHDPGRWSATTGRRRGQRVDNQLSRLVNAGKGAAGASFKLTRMILQFLEQQGLEPVICQRVVADPGRRIATAIDMICFDAAQQLLWVVELKTGFAGDRQLAARAGGRACALRRPLHRAPDTLHSRHIVQAAVGRELLVREPGFLEGLLGRFGALEVRSAILYANGNSVDFLIVDDWWERRAAQVLTTLA